MEEKDFQCMSQILRYRLRGIAAGIRGALGLIEEEAGSQLPAGLLEYFPLMIRECDALQEVATRLSLFFDQPPPAEPMTADVVMMRYFAGLSIEETAAALGVSPATVKNDWTFARAWLNNELSKERPEREKE